MSTTEDTTQTESPTNAAETVAANTAVAEARGALAMIEDGLEALEDADLSNVDDSTLADLYAELRGAEKGVEETRKEVVGEEVEARADAGESIESRDVSVTVVESHNKYVEDDDAALQALFAAGVNPREVTEVNASDLSEVAEEEEIEQAAEQVGEYSYTYERVTEKGE
jgi:hypothetical protein